MAARKPAAAAAAPAIPAGPVYTPEQQAERHVLVEEIRALQAQVAAEAREALVLREEREKLNAAWAGAKAEVERKRAEARAKDADIAEQAAAHAVELKLHKQRVRELLAANASAAGDGRVAGLRALKLAAESHVESERELKADKRDLAVALKEVEAGHEELVRVLKMEQDRAVTTLRFQFEAQARELAALYDDKMTRCRDEMNTAREEEVKAVEARKAAHVAAMLSAHERAFADIKAYFNEITHSNLDLIKSLKEELDDMRKKEAGDEKVMHAIAAENTRMSDPMRKAIADVKRLREEREAYRKDIVALQEAKAAALVVTDRLEALRWEHEILAQRFDRLAAERDALSAKFAEAVHEIQQKAGFKQLLLEQKVAAASAESERAQMALAEVLAHANVDPATVGAGGEGALRGAQGIAERDAQIAELQATVAQLAAAYDGCIDAFKAKMAEKSIPVAELGFPLATASQILLGPRAAPAPG